MRANLQVSRGKRSRSRSNRTNIPDVQAHVVSETKEQHTGYRLPGTLLTTTTTTTSSNTNCICNPHLRDPMTVAISFMPNPGLFRVACKFTIECWDQAVYLEGFLPCHHLTWEDEEDPRYANPHHLLPSPTSYEYEEDPRYANPHHLLPSPTSYEYEEYTPCTIIIIPPYTPVATEELAVSLSASVPVRRFDEAAYGPQTGSESTLSYVSALKSHHPSNSKAKEKTSATTSATWHFSSETKQLLDLKLPSFLTTVALERLERLREIMTGFLAGSSSVVHVRLVELPKLVRIRDQVLGNISSLRTVRFESLPKLALIGSQVLSLCERLETAEFSLLPKLAVVHDSWLRECPSLKVITLDTLPGLCSIGPQWLLGSTLSLQVATFRHLPSLDTLNELVVSGQYPHHPVRFHFHGGMRAPTNDNAVWSISSLFLGGNAPLLEIVRLENISSALLGALPAKFKDEASFQEGKRTL